MKLDGFQFKEIIYKGINKIVYRIEDEQEKKNYMFCMPLVKNQESRQSIEREFELGSIFDSRYIVEHIELKENEDIIGILMEDFNARTLKDYYKSNKVGIEDFLKIGIQITGALKVIHEMNVIHRNMSTKNVLINPYTKNIKLCDFSRSTFLEESEFDYIDLEKSNKELSYISPEETGITNRLIDKRSDFYSLGIILYELLYSKMPFDDKSNFEILTKHLSFKPDMMKKNDKFEIPGILRKIVFKLLEKDPQNRYRSCDGILFDLKKCLAIYSDDGELHDFEIGKNDDSRELYVSQKLYGRKESFENILKSFNRVIENKSREVLVINGKEGMGKTFLVNELKKPAMLKRGYFTSYKCDEHKKGNPFGGVREVIKSIMNQMYQIENPLTIEKWKNEMIENFDGGGRTLVDFIPELEKFLGEFDEIEDLGTTENQNRFNRALRVFLRFFIEKKKPIVIFLDDIQWIDSGTLSYVIELLRSDDTGSTMLILAHRPEIDTNNEILEELELSKSRIRRVDVDIKPLDRSQIDMFISDTFNCDIDDVGDLGNTVKQKTLGNPFYIKMFLKNMYEEGVIFKSDGKLSWDPKELNEKSATQNVLNSMVDIVKNLTGSTKELIMDASCLGYKFDISFLAKLMNLKEQQIELYLKPLIASGIVFRNYRGYSFSNNRIYEEVYSMIEEEDLSRKHFKIAKTLLKTLSDQELDNRIFEVVNHFNLSKSVINDEKRDVAKLNMKAAIKAKATHSYDTAFYYISQAKEYVLEDMSWEEDYNLIKNIYMEYLEIEFLNERFEKIEDTAQSIMKNLISETEKIEVCNFIVSKNNYLGKHMEAVEVALKSLDLLGVSISQQDMKKEFEIENKKLRTNLEGKRIRDLITMKEIQNKNTILTLETLMLCAQASYFIDHDLWAYCIAKWMNISIESGIYEKSPSGFARYGIMISNLFGDYEKSYEFANLALKVSDKMSAEEEKIEVIDMISEFILPWHVDLLRIDEILQDAFEEAQHMERLQTGGYMLNTLLRHRYIAGRDVDEIRETLMDNLKFGYMTKNKSTIYTSIGHEMIIDNMMGKTKDYKTFSCKRMEEDDYIYNLMKYNMSIHLYSYYILKSLNFYLYSMDQEALKILKKVKLYMSYITPTYYTMYFNFVYSLVITSILYREEMDIEEKKKLWADLEKNQEEMKAWIEINPDQVEGKYQLIQAEMAKISKDFVEAIELYNKAIENIAKTENHLDEGIANELAGRFWIERGNRKIAKSYLEDCYDAYKRWGGKRKIYKVEEDYLEELSSMISSKYISSVLDESKKRTSLNQMAISDMEALGKLSNIISRETNLEKLLEKAMKIIKDSSNSDKIYMIVEENSKLFEIARYDDEVIEISLEDKNELSSLEISMDIVNYVFKTGENIVLPNSFQEEIFMKDSYFQMNKPASVLGMPIVYNDDIVGVIYMENSEMTNVYDSYKVEIMQILLSQISISIENARLYQDLEKLVKERTEKLKKSMHELKETKNHLFRLEKVASIKELLTGVLEELKEEVDDNGKDYSQALEVIEDIDDTRLDALVRRMQERNKKVMNLINSFENIIAPGSDEGAVRFNLKELIDDVIISLRHVFKNTNHRLMMECNEEIEIVSNPEIISQILVNLINNSLKHAFGGRESGEIYIRIKDSKEGIELEYGDNGVGVKKENIKDIMRPFYTTVKNGSGMGINIIYNLIKNELKGHIHLESDVDKGMHYKIQIPLSEKFIVEKNSN